MPQSDIDFCVAALTWNWRREEHCACYIVVLGARSSSITYERKDHSHF